MTSVKTMFRVSSVNAKPTAKVAPASPIVQPRPVTTTTAQPFQEEQTKQEIESKLRTFFLFVLFPKLETLF